MGWLGRSTKHHTSSATFTSLTPKSYPRKSICIEQKSLSTATGMLVTGMFLTAKFSDYYVSDSYVF